MRKVFLTGILGFMFLSFQAAQAAGRNPEQQSEGAVLSEDAVQNVTTDAEADEALGILPEEDASSESEAKKIADSMTAKSQSDETLDSLMKQRAEEEMARLHASITEDKQGGRTT